MEPDETLLESGHLIFVRGLDRFLNGCESMPTVDAPLLLLICQHDGDNAGAALLTRMFDAAGQNVDTDILEGHLLWRLAQSINDSFWHWPAQHAFSSAL